MRNRNKWLLGVFAAGLLLTGVGAGITFAEWSGLTYGGVYTAAIGESENVTITQKVELAAGQPLMVNNLPEEREILVDKSLPAGTLTFDLTYDAEAEKPELYYHSAEWNEEQKDPDNLILSCYYAGSELRWIMGGKDVVLQNLREGKLIEYRMPEAVRSAKIRVAPDLAERLLDSYGRSIEVLKG